MLHVFSCFRLSHLIPLTHARSHTNRHALPRTHTDLPTLIHVLDATDCRRWSGCIPRADEAERSHSIPLVTGAGAWLTVYVFRSAGAHRKSMVHPTTFSLNTPTPPSIPIDSRCSSSHNATTVCSFYTPQTGVAVGGVRVMLAKYGLTIRCL